MSCFKDKVLSSLQRIEHALAALNTNLEKHMAKLDDEIAALQAEVTNNTTVEKSAITLIQSLGTQLAAAIAAANAAGATPVQLQALTDLQAALSANDTALAAAVAANTTPPPPVTPAP